MEELQLGVELRVRRDDVLILVFPKLPHNFLLRHPELVLELIQRGVVGARSGLLVRPSVVA